MLYPQLFGFNGDISEYFRLVIIGCSSALVWMAIGGFLNLASSLPIYLSFKKGIFYGVK